MTQTPLETFILLYLCDQRPLTKSDLQMSGNNFPNGRSSRLPKLDRSRRSQRCQVFKTFIGLDSDSGSKVPTLPSLSFGLLFISIKHIMRFLQLAHGGEVRCQCEFQARFFSTFRKSRGNYCFDFKLRFCRHEVES